MLYTCSGESCAAVQTGTKPCQNPENPTRGPDEARWPSYQWHKTPDFPQGAGRGAIRGPGSPELLKPVKHLIRVQEIIRAAGCARNRHGDELTVSFSSLI